MPPSHRLTSQIPAVMALLLAIGLTLVAASAIEGFSIFKQGLGVLASRDVPGSGLWRSLGYFVLGGLGLWCAGLMQRSPKAGVRIAGLLWVIAAVAQWAQGFWPIEMNSVEALDNLRHGAAHAVWIIGLCSGAVIYAWQDRSPQVIGVAAATVLVGLCRLLEWSPVESLTWTHWALLILWPLMLVLERAGSLE